MKLSDAEAVFNKDVYLRDVILKFRDEKNNEYSFSDIKLLDSSMEVYLYCDLEPVSGPFQVEKILPYLSMAEKDMDKVIRKIGPLSFLRKIVGEYNEGNLPTITYDDGSKGFPLPVSDEFIINIELISYEKFELPYGSGQADFYYSEIIKKKTNIGKVYTLLKTPPDYCLKKKDIDLSDWQLMSVSELTGNILNVKSGEKTIDNFQDEMSYDNIIGISWDDLETERDMVYVCFNDSNNNRIVASYYKEKGIIPFLIRYGFYNEADSIKLMNG